MALAAIGTIASAVSAGASLVSTSVNAISANGALRNIVIDISNHLTTDLTCPQYYLYSGSNRMAPQPMIISLTNEVVQFDHTRGTATGTSGIISFNINDEKHPMAFAIIWSVPFDYNWSSNWFGMTFLPRGTNMDKSWYNKLYSDPAWKSPQPNTKFGYARDNKTVAIFHEDFIVSGRMSDVGKSVLKVDVQKIAGGYQKNQDMF